MLFQHFAKHWVVLAVLLPFPELRLVLLFPCTSECLFATSAEKRRAEHTEDDSGVNKRQEVMMVQASHILVKHKDSRRPRSWKVACASFDQLAAMTRYCHHH